MCPASRHGGDNGEVDREADAQAPTPAAEVQQNSFTVRRSALDAAASNVAARPAAPRVDADVADDDRCRRPTSERSHVETAAAWVDDAASVGRPARYAGVVSEPLQLRRGNGLEIQCEHLAAGVLTAGRLRAATNVGDLASVR
jgi:hypothetical protein